MANPFWVFVRELFAPSRNWGRPSNGLVAKSYQKKGLALLRFFVTELRALRPGRTGGREPPLVLLALEPGVAAARTRRLVRRRGGDNPRQGDLLAHHFPSVVGPAEEFDDADGLAKEVDRCHLHSGRFVGALGECLVDGLDQAKELRTALGIRPERGDCVLKDFPQLHQDAQPGVVPGIPGGYRCRLELALLQERIRLRHGRVGGQAEGIRRVLIPEDIPQVTMAPLEGYQGGLFPGARPGLIEHRSDDRRFQNPLRGCGQVLDDGRADARHRGVVGLARGAGLPTHALAEGLTGGLRGHIDHSFLPARGSLGAKLPNPVLPLNLWKVSKKSMMVSYLPAISQSLVTKLELNHRFRVEFWLVDRIFKVKALDRGDLMPSRTALNFLVSHTSQ